MNVIDMDAAITAAWIAMPGTPIVDTGVPMMTLLRAVFIAGMREAAEIAETMGSDFDSPMVAHELSRQADELSRP